MRCQCFVVQTLVKDHSSHISSQIIDEMHISFLVQIPFECIKEIINIFKFTIRVITYIHALWDISFNLLGEPSKILSMLSDLTSYSPLLCCIVVIQPVAHIISIIRLGFISFISYCPICHTTPAKGSRSSCDGSGGHHPGSRSCHSESSTAYSVGQGSHNCSSGGNCSSHWDPSGCSLICGTHQTPLRLTSMVSTSNLQTPLTLKALPNDNAK